MMVMGSSKPNEVLRGQTILSLLLVTIALTFILSIVLVELVYIWKTFSTSYFLLAQLCIFTGGVIMVINVGLGRRFNDIKMADKSCNYKPNNIINDSMNKQISESSGGETRNSDENKENLNGGEIEHLCDGKRSKKQRKREKKLKKQLEEKGKPCNVLKLRQPTVNEKISYAVTTLTIDDNIKSDVVDNKHIDSFELPRTVINDRQNCIVNNRKNKGLKPPPRMQKNKEEDLRKISLMNRFSKKFNNDWVAASSSITSLTTTNSTPSSCISMSANSSAKSGTPVSSFSCSLTYQSNRIMDTVASTPSLILPLPVNSFSSHTSQTNLLNVTNSKDAASKETDESAGLTGPEDDLVFKSSSFFSTPKRDEVTLLQPTIVKEYSLFGTSQFNSCLVWSPIGL